MYILVYIMHFMKITYRQCYDFVEQHHRWHMEVEYKVLEKIIYYYKNYLRSTKGTKKKQKGIISDTY